MLASWANLWDAVRSLLDRLDRMPFPAAHPSLLQALAERGYAEPTPVQAAVLAADAAGRDLLVSAQTGSGKTVAFGLAMAPDAARRGRALRRRPAAPLALVIAPTRELALQVERELSWLYAASRRPRRRLRRRHGHPPRAAARWPQGAHIVVGTPGRLRDHLERGNLDVSALQGRGARRGRRDARPGLSRGPRVHPRRHAGRAPHAAVLGHHPQARSPRWPSATSATRCASPPPASARRTATSSTARCAIAPNEREHAVVNVLRFFEAPRRARLLRDPRGRAPPARQPARARLLRRRAVGRADPERAHPRAAGAARRPRPGLRRHRRRRARPRPARPRPRHPRRPAATTARRCSTAAAAPAAPAARASRC